MSALPPLVPGDDYPVVFTFTVKATGAPVDQTGNSIELMIKALASDADAAALSNISFNAVSPDAELGIIRGVIPRADTRGFPQNSQVHLQARRNVGGIKRTCLLTRIRTLDSVIDDT